MVLQSCSPAEAVVPLVLMVRVLRESVLPRFLVHPSAVIRLRDFLPRLLEERVTGATAMRDLLLTEAALNTAEVATVATPPRSCRV